MTAVVGVVALGCIWGPFPMILGIFLPIFLFSKPCSVAVTRLLPAAPRASPCDRGTMGDKGPEEQRGTKNTVVEAESSLADCLAISWALQARGSLLPNRTHSRTLSLCSWDTRDLQEYGDDVHFLDFYLFLNIYSLYPSHIYL